MKGVFSRRLVTVVKIHLPPLHGTFFSRNRSVAVGWKKRGKAAGEAFNFSRLRADISHKENPGKRMTSELTGTRDGPKGGNFNSLSRRWFAAGV